MNLFNVPPWLVEEPVGEERHAEPQLRLLRGVDTVSRFVHESSRRLRHAIDAPLSGEPRTRAVDQTSRDEAVECRRCDDAEGPGDAAHQR